MLDFRFAHITCLSSLSNCGYALTHTKTDVRSSSVALTTNYQGSYWAVAHCIANQFDGGVKASMHDY